MSSAPVSIPKKTQELLSQVMSLRTQSVGLYDNSGWEDALKNDGSGDRKGIVATLLSPKTHAAGPSYKKGSADKGKSAKDVIAAKENTNDPASSLHNSRTGIQPHPFNMRECSRFQWQNEYHSACIAKKVACAVGLGFRDGLVSVEDPKTKKVTKEYRLSKVDKALNGLCLGSFRSVLRACMEDFAQTETAYLEVVRDEQDKIIGIHHNPAHTTFVNVEDARYSYHYESFPDAGTDNTAYFCAFGDKEAFLKRMGRPITGEEKMKVSELIAIRQPSSFSKWYGFPKWLSCVPRIELSQMSVQQRYDFYNNLACPEFMLFLLGKKLPKEQWEAINNSLKSTIGAGNAHKSLVVNVEDSDMKVQLEKLAMDGQGETSLEFAEGLEGLGRGILVAHGVPNLIVGISVAGKSGASNELTQALMLFQWTTVGPVQAILEMALGATLGGPLGVKGLTPEDFTLTRLTDVLDLGVVPVPDQSPEGGAGGAGSQDEGDPSPGAAGGSGAGVVDTLGRARKPMADGRSPSDGLRQH